jgi:hypothetical protein
MGFLIRTMTVYALTRLTSITLMLEFGTQTSLARIAAGAFIELDYKSPFRYLMMFAHSSKSMKEHAGMQRLSRR